MGDQRLETRLLFADTFDDLDARTTLGDGSVWPLRDGQLVGRWGREGSSTFCSKPLDRLVEVCSDRVVLLMGGGKTSGDEGGSTAGELAPR